MKLPFDVEVAENYQMVSIVHRLKVLQIYKGQVISKCLLGVYTFSQKTNENKSTSSKDELFRSFFGRKCDTKETF